jgi:hypothetical protein
MEEQVLLLYVSSLSELESGSPWKRKQHRKYSCNIGYIRRNISFDIKPNKPLLFLTKSEITSPFPMSERALEERKNQRIRDRSTKYSKILYEG